MADAPDKPVPEATAVTSEISPALEVRASTPVEAIAVTSEISPALEVRASTPVEAIAVTSEISPALEVRASTPVEAIAVTSEISPALEVKAPTPVEATAGTSKSSPALGVKAQTPVEAIAGTSKSSPALEVKAQTPVEAIAGTSKSSPALGVKAQTPVEAIAGTSKSSPALGVKAPTPVEAVAFVKSTSNMSESSDDKDTVSIPPLFEPSPDSKSPQGSDKNSRSSGGMNPTETTDLTETQEQDYTSMLSEYSLYRVVTGLSPDDSGSLDVSSRSRLTNSPISKTIHDFGDNTKVDNKKPESPESCCGIHWSHWFPNMCGCLQGESSSSTKSAAPSNSEKVGSINNVFELGSLNSSYEPSTSRCDTDSERLEELVFYNDDGSYQSVIIEKNLRSIDLCQILAVKNRVAKDKSWAIVESWPEVGLERSLEDHEDVLRVYRDMEYFAPNTPKRLVFRQDFRKYEFFHDSKQFFPEEMVDYESSAFLGPFTNKYAVMQNMITTGEKCPSIFSSAWIRDPSKNVWSKIYMVLRETKLYCSPKIHLVSRVIRQWRHIDSAAATSTSTPKRTPLSNTATTPKRSLTSGSSGTPKRSLASNLEQLEVLANLPDFHVYTTVNAKKQFRAPTQWGLVLRPVTNTKSKKKAGSDFRCITFDNEKTRACWIIAMRLAKLRENYRAFKNKQCEPTVSSGNYNSYSVPNESVRSRVAMDFTGSVGRIVDDPKEAKAIAVAEGSTWKRRWRPSSRAPHDQNLAKIQELEAGIHVTQLWFHRGMSRDQAAALVNKYGTVDGVFLVRDSRSNPGAFVLTYKSGGKVLHTQIQLITDHHLRDTYCYSLDSGATKFYDLLQLVEFYQLNTGCLPTRLTHYVVHSPSNTMIQEDTSMTSLSPGSSPGPRNSPSLTPRTSTPSITSA
ncbi:growth factor receptor-bound protein 10 isoform X3 [Neodiprion lecontei]|uniref:Growth factor receptor-bound protein 10 isoform X3 n=1 Tax=Neodiprion lecontei TaxID=441921 RepID=A0ABM3FYU2_NEOLC|nr:growth factor receptor-bound protein 10 isoform X3 [Neodiprion lecontei]